MESQMPNLALKQMDMKKYNFGELQELLYNTALDNGWFDTDTKDPNWIGTQIALMHSELSEALDVFRKLKDIKEIDEVFEGLVEPKGFFVEMADACMRIMVLAERFNVDLERIIILKNSINKLRGYKHGGRLI